MTVVIRSFVAVCACVEVNVRVSLTKNLRAGYVADYGSQSSGDQNTIFGKTDPPMSGALSRSNRTIKKVECTLLKKTLAFQGGTSNLRNHLLSLPLCCLWKAQDEG